MSATAIDLVDYNVTERTNIQDIRKDAIEPITLHAIVRDACVSAALLTHGTCTRHTNTARRARGALPDDPLGRALASWLLLSSLLRLSDSHGSCHKVGCSHAVVSTGNAAGRLRLRARSASL